MEYKYNLAKLQYDKEKMEELITRHNRRIGQVFPQKLEQEFWRLNLERARRNINDFLWSGVLAYFIFAIFTIPGDYWIIEQSHFKQDFIHCLLGLLNGAVCLLFLYVFSHFVKGSWLCLRRSQLKAPGEPAQRASKGISDLHANIRWLC